MKEEGKGKERCSCSMSGRVSKGSARRFVTKQGKVREMREEEGVRFKLSRCAV